MDHKLNVRCMTTKLSEEKTGVNFHDLALRKSFLDPRPKAQVKKKDQLYTIKIKTLCFMLYHKKVKRQLTE